MLAMQTLTSDNIEIMINDDEEEVMKELFDLLKNRYQNNLESIKGSEFVFDYIQFLVSLFLIIFSFCLITVIK